MASRSLNKVILIGNLTRDPELKYTSQGTPVCTFGLATNRYWNTDQGEKKEDVEFHTVVAWNRLAEIVAEYMQKGRQAYVEGRLSTREWDAPDGGKRQRTEIIASEVIFLGSGAGAGFGGAKQEDDIDIPADFGLGEESAPKTVNKTEPKQSPANDIPDGADEDIPF